MEPPSYANLPDVLLAAVEKYQERSAQYDGDDPWGKGGYKAQLVEMRKKLDRLWTHWDGEKGFNQVEDDALDLINYAAFFLILAERGDSDGQWPWQQEATTEADKRPASAQSLGGQDPDSPRAQALAAAREAWQQVGDALRQLASS